MAEEMIYRRLGKSGLKLSLFSFGSWVTFGRQVDRKLALRLMSQAYEAGINFFDNAEVYEAGESEKIMGEALRELGWSRDSFTVSSKVFWGGDRPTQRGLSHKHIYDACHAALRRLQVDYLDLYFCHRPDVDTPIEETVRAMHNLVTQGKILYWGTSEWSAAEIQEAYGVAGQFNLTPPTMEQPQYNMFERGKVEQDYLRLFLEKGLGTTIWSPLASGLLTGKYNKGIPTDSRMGMPGYEWLRDRVMAADFPRKIEQVQRLEGLARELGGTLPQLALAWCASNPNVSTVILGASKEAQLKENLAALPLVAKIDANVRSKIDGILGNKPVGLVRF